jgi:hypothetical protein
MAFGAVTALALVTSMLTARTVATAPSGFFDIPEGYRQI